MLFLLSLLGESGGLSGGAGLQVEVLAAKQQKYYFPIKGIFKCKKPF